VPQRRAGTVSLVTGDAVGRVEHEITVLLRRTLEDVWSRGYGDGPIDRFTYPVLALLDEHGPLGLSDLTARLGLSKPTVSRQVTRLAAADLVATRPDRRDPRAVSVSLTAAGEEQVRRVRDMRRRSLSAVLASWTETDSHTLAALLARLNADLDDLRGERGQP
jgi:DNA-binding MarR family transcriptional regulator